MRANQVLGGGGEVVKEEEKEEGEREQGGVGEEAPWRGDVMGFLEDDVIPSAQGKDLKPQRSSHLPPTSFHSCDNN